MPLPPFPSLQHNLQTDVLIIGGGICGLLCAYMLAQEGVNYALVESERICGKTSGNTTAKVTFQHGLIYSKLLNTVGLEKTQMYLEANRRALVQYRSICENCDCEFESKDAIVYSLDSVAKLEQEYNAYETLGISAEFIKTLPLPFPSVGGLRVRDQGQIHPLKLAAFLAAKLNIYENTPVLAYDGRSVITPHANITASHIIVTTHFPIFNKHGAYFLKMYQHRSYVTALNNVPVFPEMYIDEAEDGLSFRSYQNHLLVGGGAHRTGKKGGNWQALTAFSQAYFPGANERYRWAAQDCMTLDGIPYIGEYSRSTPNLYTATGFQKWGFSTSMAAASILCDMIQGRKSEIAEVFSPSRTVMRPQLFRNIAESGIQFLTPTVPRCPHLGCVLKWNRHEHSWDCPCHGSRFTAQGRVLESPANKKAFRIQRNQ